jgi:hypothetical protein
VYLSEVKVSLQENDFEKTKLCSDRDGQPPMQVDKREFWWAESERFLQNADVAVFFFLDNTLSRPLLSDDAFIESTGELPPVYGPYRAGNSDPYWDANAPEMNSSVALELMYWLETQDDHQKRTLVIFEGEMLDKLGSLVPGLVMKRGVDFEQIEPECVSEAIDETRQRCMNWVMNECRSFLRERHDSD